MGVLRDSDNSWYMREEAGGSLLVLRKKELHVVMWTDHLKTVSMNYFKKI